MKGPVLQLPTLTESQAYLFFFKSGRCFYLVQAASKSCAICAICEHNIKKALLKTLIVIYI